jgi:segregation and condensation protein B
MTNLISQLESLLFVSNKPLSLKQLAKFTGGTEAEIESALQELSAQRSESGVVLLNAPDGYQLATHSENTEVVKNFLNSDLRESLTEATVEVLAIIGYRQPISKAEIESIRGVNSQYSIRALLMRGLIEKIPNPNDARGSLYQITTEFLQQLGITSVKDLPDFDELVAKIQLPETAGLTMEAKNNASEASQQIDEPSENLE